MQNPVPTRESSRIVQRRTLIYRFVGDSGTSVARRQANRVLRRRTVLAAAGCYFIVSTLIVVDDIKEWPFEIAGVDVVDGEAYLTQPSFGSLGRAQLFNLCRSYKYQSTGYYVTLLAAARGHRPMPDLVTIQDLKSQTQVRSVSDELDELIQQSLRRVHAREFTLSVYFGHNLARRYDRLSVHLFNLLEAPLIRATFARPNGKWVLRTVNPIPVGEIPLRHRDFVFERACEYFSGRRSKVPKRATPKYKMGILIDPEEVEPPSNPAAIENFLSAADEGGFATEIIGRDDFSRLAEFDALFIRETTHVNHYTYRFARRAATEGLAVVDDPESILKCTNKVYLAELLARQQMPIPRTIIVHRGNIASVGSLLGFPCILKLPDASFSQGVVKVDDERSLKQKVREFLAQSDLVVAQEFVPTRFDWRVGVWDRQPLFACRYHMAKDHWQIIKRDKAGKRSEGPVEDVPLDEAPRAVVDTAVASANLIGDGLYGVDLKEIGGRACVIEINDNPNIDAGHEDQVLKEELYRRIVGGFAGRIERSRSEPVVPAGQPG